MNRKIYIWQQEDWPRFTWDEAALREPLARAAMLHGQLTGRMEMMGRNEKESTQVDALSRELFSSSAIEGVALNMDSLRSSLARALGAEMQYEPVADHYVEGLVEVLFDAISGKHQALSQEMLFGWHRVLFPYGQSGLGRIDVGRWRTGEDAMQVVSGALGHQKVHYEAPPSADVPREMDRFLRWGATAALNPILKAAIAHLWFVTVHPFDDGNGRLARTVADFFLSALDTDGRRYYSMSAEINREKKEYYAVLEATQKGGTDITRWLVWFVESFARAIGGALATTDRIVAKALYWEHNSGKALNPRQQKIVNMLWDGFDGKLTTSKYAKINKCSQDTAYRDILDLIAKRMLRESAEGGRSKNYLLPL